MTVPQTQKRKTSLSGAARERWATRFARRNATVEANGSRWAVLRNTGYYGGGQLIAVLCSTVTALVTARVLGASGRGAFAATTSAASILAVGFLFGSTMAAPSYVARGLLSVRGAFGIGILLSAVGALASLVLEWTYGATLSLPVGPMSTLLIALAASGIMMSAMQSAAASGVGRLGASGLNALVTGLTTAVGVCVLLPPSAPSNRLVVALAAWVAGQWMGDVAGWVLLFRGGRGVLSPRLPVRSFVRFATAAYPGTVVGQLAFRLDLVVLPLLAGTSEAGVYSIAVVAGSLVALAPSALAQAMTHPLGGMSSAAGVRLVRSAVMATLAMAGGLGVLLLLALRLLAVPLLGPSFSDAASVFSVLLPGVVLFAPVHILVIYANTCLLRPGLSSWVTGVVLVSDLTLLWFLAPGYGASGAALASSVSYAIGAGVMLAGVRMMPARHAEE